MCSNQQRILCSLHCSFCYLLSPSSLQTITDQTLTHQARYGTEEGSRFTFQSPPTGEIFKAQISHFSLLPVTTARHSLCFSHCTPCCPVSAQSISGCRRDSHDQGFRYPECTLNFSRAKAAFWCLNWNHTYYYIAKFSHGQVFVVPNEFTHLWAGPLLEYEQLQPLFLLRHVIFRGLNFQH